MVTKAEKRAAKAAERKAYTERRLSNLRRAQQYMQAGKCPSCGCGLRRNNSLTGWWQCNALGAVGFQTGDGIGKPPCNFQFFYDPTEQEREQLIDEKIQWPVEVRDDCGLRRKAPDNLSRGNGFGPCGGRS